MAENVLAMVLRMRNTATTTVRNLKNETKAAGVEATTMGTKFGKSIKATRTSTAGLAGSLVSLKAIIIATFAVRALQKFTGFVGGLTDAYDDQTEAVLLLGEALAGSQQFSQENLNNLVNYSSALQESTANADDLIIKQMALLATYKLQADEIKELTPLIIDFAKAKQINLKTAFDLVGKASVGYTGTLSRYGIILESTLSAEEKFAQFKLILAEYSGTAAAAADTYRGEVERLKLAYSDMKEPMGESIAMGIEESGVLVTLNSLIAENAGWWEKWGIVVGEDVSNQVGKLNTALGVLKDFFTSPLMLQWGITFINTIDNIQIVFRQLGLRITAGLKEASIAMEGLVIMGSQVWAILRGNKSDYKMYAQAADVWRDTWIDRISDVDKEYTDMWEELDRRGTANQEQIAAIWEEGGVEKWKAAQEMRRKELQKTSDAEQFLIDIQKKNRKEYNDAVKETIKLTQSMAQQFATASRLEQEQTKFLIEKIKSMEPEDIENLTDQEKKLIGKQGILKKIMEGLFTEYTKDKIGGDLNKRVPQVIQDNMAADRDTDIKAEITRLESERKAMFDRYEKVKEGLTGEKRQEVHQGFRERGWEMIDEIRALKEKLSPAERQEKEEITEAEQRRRDKDLGSRETETTAIRIDLTDDARLLLKIDNTNISQNARDFERATA
jgi:hypothetical protein